MTFMSTTIKAGPRLSLGNLRSGAGGRTFLPQLTDSAQRFSDINFGMSSDFQRTRTSPLMLRRCERRSLESLVEVVRQVLIVRVANVIYLQFTSEWSVADRARSVKKRSSVGQTHLNCKQLKRLHFKVSNEFGICLSPVA